MLNRIAYRLKDTSLTLIFAGIFLMIPPDYRIYGGYLIIGGIVFYLFFNWLYKKTIPTKTYELDENGNVKKNYR